MIQDSQTKSHTTTFLSHFSLSCTGFMCSTNINIFVHRAKIIVRVMGSCEITKSVATSF